MNPFEEDDDPRPSPPPPAKAHSSTLAGKRGFEESRHESTLRGYQSAPPMDASYDVKKNPFAEDLGASAGRGSAPLGYQEGSERAAIGRTFSSGTGSAVAETSWSNQAPGNPFAASISSPIRFAAPVSRHDPKANANPFSSDESSERNHTAEYTGGLIGPSLDAGLATVVSLSIAQSEYKDSSIKALAIGHGFGLFVTQSPTKPGVTVISLRNLSSISKIDASVTIKDSVEKVYMDPAAMTVLILVKNKEGGPTDTVLFLNAQEAVLKVSGPIAALAGVSCVTWYKNDLGDYDALIGTASGSILRCRFSHNGVASSEPLLSVKNKVASLVLREEEDGLCIVEATGHIQFYNWAARQVLARCDLSSDQKHQASFKNVIVNSVLATDGDLWVASLYGVYRVHLASSNALSLSCTMVLEQEGIQGIAQTKLYVLLLSRIASKQNTVLVSKLVAISKISYQLEPQLERTRVAVQGTQARDIILDESSKHVWLVSDTGLATVDIVDELKGAWRLYLKRAIASNAAEDFQRALDFTTSKQEADQVRAAWGDWLFANKLYSAAAEQYALTSNAVKPFEEIALKLSVSSGSDENAQEGRDRRAGLRTFLIGRLNRISEHKKAPRTMLCTWICEAFLDEMDNISNKEVAIDLEASFCSFLGTYASSLEPAKEVIFHLILSHGRSDLLLAYAFLTRDYDRVVSHHFQRDAPAEAVRTMRDCVKTDPGSAAQLFYKYSPILIERCPQLLIDTWIELKAALEPVKLVPALSKLEHGDVEVRHHAVRYLRFAIEQLQCRDEPVHNALLSAYSNDEEAFAQFIEAQATRPGGFCFDVSFALRLCDQVSPRSKVTLLNAIGSAEAACLSALHLGMRDIAQRIAQEQYASSPAISRKLWLVICKDALENEGSPEAALRILRASDGAIDVESVLQLMPDSIKLDEVRDEICAALERYNMEIDQLKAEMKQQFESEQNLRKVARNERQRFDRVKVSKCCDLCRKRIFSERAPNGGPVQLADRVNDFYVFPCTHVFHSECLIRCLPPDEQSRARELHTSELESDQAHAEELIAESCPLCGDRMIEAVALPLVFAEDEAAARKWDVPSNGS